MMRRPLVSRYASSCPVRICMTRNSDDTRRYEAHCSRESSLLLEIDTRLSGVHVAVIGWVDISIGECARDFSCGDQGVVRSRPPARSGLIFDPGGLFSADGEFLAQLALARLEVQLADPLVDSLTRRHQPSAVIPRPHPDAKRDLFQRRPRDGDVAAL